MPALVVVPTYNELANLKPLLDGVKKSVPDVHVLIVDDGSPDGTGRLADEMSAGDPSISVLHRRTKDGLGRAYVAGFEWAMARGYDPVVQMDADLSHDPADLPRLIEASHSNDLVLGSRYVPGGGTRNWGVGRRVLSRGGSLYARTLLGLSIQDLTGGYKCWRLDALRAVDPTTVVSNGYSFQIEMTWRALRRGLRVGEIPILFSDRVDGVSKMSRRIVREAMGMVWRLRASRWPD
jgi:dolichol-phosphate mannosyltransferase